MSQTDASETESDRPSAALELLTLLAAGAAGPDRVDRPARPAPDRLGRSAADRAPDGPRRSDLRERLTDGVVELRKRGQFATRRAATSGAPGTSAPAGAPGPSGAPGASAAEHHLEAMALRAAERAGRPRA